MKNYFLLPLLALFCLSVNVPAQQQMIASSRKTPIDSMLLDLEKAIAQNHIPGLLVSIVDRSGVIYSGGVGYADMEKKNIVNGKTRFRFASVTKMFTALAIEKLISEGKLKLDDPIKKIAPEIPFANSWEDTNPVRVINLLEHTAGFEDVQLGRIIAKDRKSLVKLEAIRFHRTSLVSRWKPGERMAYSSPGYEVLGYLIEKLSGMGVDRYIEKNILLPLGMDNSAILMNSGATEKISTAYHFTGKGYQILKPYTLASNGAAGNLVSCADDVSKFMISLLNYHQNSRYPIVPLANAMEMDSVHSSLAARKGLQTGYALGNVLFANNKKISFRGHQGLGEGFSSWILYNKPKGIAYAIANNSGADNWRISQIIESLITDDLPEMTPNVINGSMKQFKEFTGYYAMANPKNARLDFLKGIFNTLQLRISGQKIILRTSSGNIDTLVQVGKNLFSIRSEIIPTFILSKTEDGSPFIQGYNNSVFYTRVPEASILAKKYLIYAGIGAMMLGMLMTMIAVVMLVLRKINFRMFALVSMPGIAAVLGLLAYHRLIITDEVNKVAFSSINGTTLFIFFTSLGFGVLSLVSFVLLAQQWHKLTNRWLKGILTLNILMICYLTGIFLFNGWIGMRTWVF